MLLLASTMLFIGGCTKSNLVDNTVVASPAEAIEETKKVWLEPISVYGVELEMGKPITEDAIDMIYDFYVSKETYFYDIEKTLYTYEEYIDNFAEYKENISDSNPEEYGYPWFLLMGGQKATGEYVGLSVYNTTDKHISVNEATLSNLYVLLDEYSSISYEGLKYGSTKDDMVNALGDYTSFFEQSDEDYGYDEEYNYIYNNGQTYLTFKFKDGGLISILAADIMDTKAKIDEYDEKVKDEEWNAG